MFTHGNIVDQWFTLNRGNKRAGDVNLRIQLVGGNIKNAGPKASKKMGYGMPVGQPYPQQAPPYQQPMQVPGYGQPVPGGYAPTAPPPSAPISQPGLNDVFDDM